MRNAGTETLVIKRLSDDRHDWIGSIVVDYAQPTNIELPYVKGMLYEVANDATIYPSRDRRQTLIFDK